MKKIIPIAALVLSLAATGVNAQVKITENELNMNTGILTVKGVTDQPNTDVSLNIPKIGITPENLQASDAAGENIIYSGQVSSNQEGEFTFLVDFDGADEGIYDVYVGGKTVATPILTGVSYLISENYENLIAELNSAAKADETEFNNLFDKNHENLFTCSDIKVDNKDYARKMLYNFAKNDGFVSTDSNFNLSVYKTALVAQLINDGRVSEAEDLIDSMYVVEEGIIEKYNSIADFKTYIDTDTKKAHFASIFKDCDTLATFDKEFVNAMLLTVVKHPDNVTKLKTIFEKYHLYTGANTDNAILSDYSAISGNQYSDIAVCVKAFNDEVGGPGGGGGGSSSRPDSSSDFGIITPGGADINGGKIDIKFEDLNSVPWAYSAISELFERKIISGKSETRFAPNDRVTREEFATLLVKMAGVNVENGNNAFKDVDSGAWYNGYVNTAYKRGFCNGTGKGIFGIGMEITRQDMCVMAYNALKALGRNVPDSTLNFADNSAVAEYAKAPVAALNGAGIVNGVGNNCFNPTGNATRAEAAVIIYKVLMYIR